MPIRLEFNGSVIELKEVKNNQKSFNLVSLVNDTIIKIEYLLEVRDCDSPEDFFVEVLYKVNVNENDIFQLFDSGERIGWVFPIIALDSSEHDYANEPHFLDYAYNAFIHLLRDKDCKSKLIHYNYTNVFYKISELYDDDAVVCILYKGFLPNPDKYLPHTYLPNLLKYGYRYNRTDIESKIVPERDKINLKPLSLELHDDIYMKLLLTDYLCSNTSNYLYKFIVLYQVLELLMARVVNEQIVKIGEKIKICNGDFLQIKNMIFDITNEEKRLNIVFNDSCHLCTSNYEELIQKCNDLFANLNYDIRLTTLAVIYQLRNILVHNYRLINSSHNALIGSIVYDFEILISDILVFYSSVKQKIENTDEVTQ